MCLPHLVWQAQADPVDFAVDRERGRAGFRFIQRAAGQSTVPWYEETGPVCWRALDQAQQLFFVGDFAVQAQGAGDEGGRLCQDGRIVGGEGFQGADFPVQPVELKCLAKLMEVGLLALSIGRGKEPGGLQCAQLAQGCAGIGVGPAGFSVLFAGFGKLGNFLAQEGFGGVPCGVCPGNEAGAGDDGKCAGDQRALQAAEIG